MKLYLEGVGLRGPGIADWASGQEILTECALYQPTEVILTASGALPAAERRRTTETVKLAITVGDEAMSQAGASPEITPSVFTSSGGDGVTITAILEILASPQREVSPTRFHNSVHNAPAGYWSIANQSKEASTSICAHDFSFTAGLLEAATRALVEQRVILLVSYDLSYPPTLNAVREIIGVCGVALVISPHRTPRSLAILSISINQDERQETVMASKDLESLRARNPTGRALPLLAAVAQTEERAITMAYVAGNFLTIHVTPLAKTPA